MTRQEPSLAQIHDAITGLPRDEEIATLATLDPHGCPSASAS
jgi:hypothetical protein